MAEHNPNDELSLEELEGVAGGTDEDAPALNTNGCGGGSCPNAAGGCGGTEN